MNNLLALFCATSASSISTCPSTLGYKFDLLLIRDKLNIRNMEVLVGLRFSKKHTTYMYRLCNKSIGKIKRKYWKGTYTE
jgi:hypothetical protein